MARRVTFDQDPLAVFLDYQLPQMMAEANEKDKQRIHDRDMIELRADIRDEGLEKENSLAQELALNTFNLDVAKERFDALNTSITSKSEALRSLNLIPEQWALQKDENKSSGSNELFNLIQSEEQRDLSTNVKAADNIMDQLSNYQESSQYLTESLDIINRMNVGIAEGAQAAKEVEDYDENMILNADDFYHYQDSVANPFIEGSPEYQGFMGQIPSFEEQTKLGKTALQMQRTMQLINKSEVDMDYKRLMTQAKMQELLGDFSGSVDSKSRASTKVYNSLMPEGKKKLGTWEWGKNFHFHPSDLFFDKDALDEDPMLVEQLKGNLESNVASMLQGIDDSAMDDSIRDRAKLILSSNDSEERKKAMDYIASYYLDVDVGTRDKRINHGDFAGISVPFISGKGEATENEKLFFIQHLKHYRDISGTQTSLGSLGKLGLGLPQDLQEELGIVELLASMPEVGDEESAIAILDSLSQGQ